MSTQNWLVDMLTIRLETKTSKFLLVIIDIKA